MYKKILYPIKFEEFSLDVLSCVLNFKKAGMKEIVLLHVIDVSRLPMDKYEGYSKEDVERFKEIARAKMEEPAGMIKKAGLKARQRVEVGITYREILRVAEEEKISLIVSGRQKKGMLGEIFIGSNTDKVIRYGKLPVYIPKYPAMFGADKEACEKFCSRLFSRVLYPTDWSDCSKAALNYIKGLKDTGIQEIVAAHVMDEKAMSAQSQKGLKEFWNLDMEKLEAVKEELIREGFRVKTHIRIGRPNTDIIKIAGEENISLIVMSTHGKGYVKGVLWGSVSRNVVEYSDKPVLLVKGEECLKKI